MSDREGNATPSASPKDGDSKNGSIKDGGPKTPTNAKNSKKNMTQIELTPIESLLFFNMVRFNGNHEKIDWNSVAAHSNLKNAASAKVRFRQILKKHGLMAQAPETPRSQAQKRKAAVKSKESQDDDEDDDSSYNPSSGAAKPSTRKRPAPRAAGSRAKRMKANLKSEHEQDDEEAVANSVVAPAPASKVDTETDTETGIKAEAKPESEPGSDTATVLLKDDGVAGGIDGTASASPYEQAQDQAPAPRGFSTGAAHLLSLGHRQSALPAYMDDTQMTQLQFRHPGMVPTITNDNGSYGFGQQFNSNQLATLQAHHDTQLQPQQLATEQLQGYQLNRFPAPHMFPYQMPGMPSRNLSFGHMAQMQLNEHVPAGSYGGVTFFDQAQLGHDLGYGHADDERFRGRVDGQDEGDLDSGNVKREVTPEAEKGVETECERVDRDEAKYDDKPKPEEI